MGGDCKSTWTVLLLRTIEAPPAVIMLVPSDISVDCVLKYNRNRIARDEQVRPDYRAHQI